MTIVRRPGYLSIPCGICCRMRVRLLPEDDPTIVSERCPDEIRAALDPDDLAANGDRLVPQREGGYCRYLSADLARCELVTEDGDRRPFRCRNWADELCAVLGCPKIEVE